MIVSFRCKETERVFYLQYSSCFPAELQGLFLRKLKMLHHSATLKDLAIPPSNRLEKLRGDRAGQWSIRINNKWRICFVWRNFEALDVEIIDYH